MADIYLARAAAEDIRSAERWYREKSPRLAARFGMAVQRALTTIAANPSMFPMIEEECRAVSLGKFPYIIVYRHMADTIQVVSVAHTSQSDDYWKGRL